MSTEKEILKKFDTLRTMNAHKKFLISPKSFTYFLDKFEEWLLKGDEMKTNDYIRGIKDMKARVLDNCDSTDLEAAWVYDKMERDLIKKEREKVIKDLETDVPKETKNVGWHLYQISFPTVQKIYDLMSDGHEVYIIYCNSEVMGSPSLHMMGKSSLFEQNPRSAMDFTFRELEYIVNDPECIFMWLEYNEGGENDG